MPINLKLLLADILVPDGRLAFIMSSARTNAPVPRVLFDEFLHQLLTLVVLERNYLDAFKLQIVFAANECIVFTLSLFSNTKLCYTDIT
jgi:hypothetical protein